MKVILALVAAFLSGCVAARDPQLVAMKQAGDSALTCDQISIEYTSNTEVAQNKIDKNNSNDRKELLLGIFVWPGLIDNKNADGNEGNALLDRNVYLRELARSKSCAGIDGLPEQPKRYTEDHQKTVHA